MEGEVRLKETLEALAGRSGDLHKEALLAGQELTQILAGKREPSGPEDPVLCALVGNEAAAIARRTGWSTLVLNPGSTSTKVAVFAGLRLVAEDEVHLAPGTPDGVAERAAYVERWLVDAGLRLEELSGIAARGGFLGPVPAGTYRFSPEMVKDLGRAAYHHASNMAIPMAVELAGRGAGNVVITTTDPVNSDDVELGSRMTGSPAFAINGAGAHYLNLRAVAQFAAIGLERPLSDIDVVVCHMGGGTSAGRISGGRVIRVLRAFGDLPSANRAGRLPLKDLAIELKAGRYGVDALEREVLRSGGGMVALTGTDDLRVLLAFREKGASPGQVVKIDLVLRFFADRIAAGLAELSTGTKLPDAVFLTGGLARSEPMLAAISERYRLPVPIARVPGSLESGALAAGLIRVLAGVEAPRSYADARDELAERRRQEDDLIHTPVFTTGRPEGIQAPVTSFDMLIELAAAGDTLPTIALVGADNEESLLAAKLAALGGRRLARFVLLGPYERTSELAWELDLPIDDDHFTLIDAEEPVGRAVALLEAGLVASLMKGSVSTAALLKGYLGTLKTRGLTRKLKLSHIGLFEIPGRGRLIGVTDAALNPSPDLAMRVAILENAVDALHRIGIASPKIAVISATEKPTEAVASSMEGRELASLFAGRPDLIIEGPLSVDLALSPESAKDKRYEGRIRGDADLLLVPTIDVGNAVYKTLTVAGRAATAGVVIGGPEPIILMSRGDSSRSKLASIALALVLAGTASKGDDA